MEPANCQVFLTVFFDGFVNEKVFLTVFSFEFSDKYIFLRRPLSRRVFNGLSAGAGGAAPISPV
jgi:hypothetical protein